MPKNHAEVQFLRDLAAKVLAAPVRITGENYGSGDIIVVETNDGPILFLSKNAVTGVYLISGRTGGLEPTIEMGEEPDFNTAGCRIIAAVAGLRAERPPGPAKTDAQILDWIEKHPQNAPHKGMDGKWHVHAHSGRESWGTAKTCREAVTQAIDGTGPDKPDRDPADNTEQSDDRAPYNFGSMYPGGG